MTEDVRTYQKLSIAEKRALDLSRAREPAVTCPLCDIQVMRADLLGHLDGRCPGRREPGPGAKWLTRREAMALGVPRRTLARWVSKGHVRWKAGPVCRLYLEGDLVDQLAPRRGARRR